MLAHHILGGGGAFPPRGCRDRGQPRVVLGRRVNRVHLGLNLRNKIFWVGIFGKVKAIVVLSEFHIPICRVEPPRTLGLAHSPFPKLFDPFVEGDSWRALASPCLATLNTLSLLVLLLLLLLLMLHRRRLGRRRIRRRRRRRRSNASRLAAHARRNLRRIRFHMGGTAADGPGPSVEAERIESPNIFTARR